MRTQQWILAGTCALAGAALFAAVVSPTFARPKQRPSQKSLDTAIARNAAALVEEGRHTFRYETFGDEDFWGGALRLHESVALATPRQLLALGLKVDAAALPKSLARGVVSGKVDLDDPATTLELLRRQAVVGVTGFFDAARVNLTGIGIQCALCHSTVDDSVTAGVGMRLDGWANRDLDVGRIVNLAPTVAPFATVLDVDEATVRTVLQSWGPGKFDAELILDGKAFRPDGGSGATLIPPAFGLAGVNLHTWTGWGSISHWNAFVAVLEMHGKGNFFDPRLKDAAQFPVAARNGFDNVRSDVDLVSPKLAGLQAYQLALPAPRAKPGSYDAVASARGDTLFSGKAQCANCHSEPLYTDSGWNMHTATVMGIDSFQSDRSPDRAYRTSPLKGLWTHAKGGFFHDGRFATLRAVVDHYNTTFTLGLTDAESNDLVEYLKSL